MSSDKPLLSDAWDEIEELRAQLAAADSEDELMCEALAKRTEECGDLMIENERLREQLELESQRSKVRGESLLAMQADRDRLLEKNQLLQDAIDNVAKQSRGWFTDALALASKPETIGGE